MDWLVCLTGQSIILKVLHENVIRIKPNRLPDMDRGTDITKPFPTQLTCKRKNQIHLLNVGQVPQRQTKQQCGVTVFTELYFAANVPDTFITLLYVPSPTYWLVRDGNTICGLEEMFLGVSNADSKLFYVLWLSVKRGQGRLLISTIPQLISTPQC